MNGLSWPELVKRLGLDKKCEADVHPHIPEERATLFHVADSGSTEHEYLNLVHALVLATKPSLVLETGTFLGYGSLAIATALRDNWHGKLITVDVDECQDARQLLKDAGLIHAVEFVQQDAVEFCRTYTGNPFGFMFHDSGGERVVEHKWLRSNQKTAVGALAVFHDTSPTRNGPSPNDWIHQIGPEANTVRLNLSRGMTIVQCA